MNKQTMGKNKKPKGYADGGSCGSKKYKRGGKVRGVGCATQGIGPCKEY
jgi:hypothetical protein